MTCAVMCPASGEVRNVIAAATSAGVPARPFAGLPTSFFRLSSDSVPPKNSVSSTTPGDTTLTVIPRPPTANARSAVQASTADLAAP